MKKNKLQIPCQYTTEELKGRLQRGHQALNNGNFKSYADLRSKVYITGEEFKEEMMNRIDAFIDK